MNAAFTLATARRILTQLRHDPRTVVMLAVVPSLLMVLLRYVLNTEQMFSRTAPALLGVFPFLIMFLITSVTTLRERTTATLERLMTLPIGKLDLLFGYAVDALTHVTRSASFDATLTRNLIIVAGAAVLALILGAATLRRRTP